MNVKVICRLCSSSKDASSNYVCVFNCCYETVKKLTWRDIIRITIGLEINKEDLISQKICTKCGQDVIKLYEFRERCLKNDRLLKDLQKKSSPRNVMHPSVIQLFNTYPGIKLPNLVLNSNFSSTVEMELDGVENYFKQKNINMNKHIRQVMKSGTLKQKNERLQECASKETVSPISIKFKNDKSGYEIVQKSSQSYSDDGKLQNEIIDLIASSSSICQTDNDRKRKISDAVTHDFNETMPQNKVLNLEMLQSGKLNVTRSPTILSNIILKTANSLKPFSDTVSGISLLPSKNDSELLPTHTVQGESKISEPDDLLVTRIEYSKCTEDEIETVLCEFCKNCFENELAHSKICFFKKTIENVPDVLVERLEDDESLKIMYRQALENLKNKDISPDIEISNSQFPDINFITDTNNLIQQLLSSDNDNQFPIEQNTQTEFDQLRLSLKTYSSSDNKVPVELKGFKSFLDLYKIPVSIKNGENFEVNFNFKNPQESTSKFEDWSKLTPVDVKIAKKTKNCTENIDPLKNLDLDREIDADTIKELLDSVNTTMTKCDETAPSNILENNTSIPYQTQTNENSTNINLNIPSLGLNYIPSLPPYPYIHNNNFNTDYQNNNGSANYLPPLLYTDKSQNNTTFTSFDQQFQNFINVNVNVYKKESRKKKNIPKNRYIPHNSVPTMNTKQIWHPPVVQSNELPHTFAVNHSCNNKRNTNSNFSFNDKERQLHNMNPNQRNFKSIPVYNKHSTHYNSFQSHPYCNISNYNQNVNYTSNNNEIVDMSYGILQNSSNNTSSDSCDSNLSSIRVRPISDLK